MHTFPKTLQLVPNRTLISPLKDTCKCHVLVTPSHTERSSYTESACDIMYFFLFLSVRFVMVVTMWADQG